MVKYATHEARKAEQKKIDEQTPNLSYDEATRKFLKGGGVRPLKKSDWCCLFCGHEYIDEPASNANNEKKFLAEIRQYEQKQQAEDSQNGGAGNNNSKLKKPKMPKPYQLCHCHKFRCVGPSSLGSTCPIKCINPVTNQRYPIVEGKCTCPLCKCICQISYAVGASEHLTLKQQLDDSAMDQQKQLGVQASRQRVSFFTSESMNQTLTSIANNRGASKMSHADVANLAKSNAARAVAHMFDPTNNKPYLQEMRGEIGRPTTKTRLPAPLMYGGVETANGKLSSLQL
ncbi:hypothetical protein SEMRO_889_G216550.1 [Seminavis robusta]|uniref:Uncharacterized protein n=1 Tax=Seminavis robusta TaxID=568900 RepID=A0A9N8HPB6_9STRA|nr:hypothetical protein SEMRO_889_G216550.1 [Seminavis robusta]|eukprot:Sro889_g216550.1 n/a (286) ;mRNA; r:16253-17110